MVQWLRLMFPFFPARHLLLYDLQVILPSRLSLNLHQNVSAHELQDLVPQVTLGVLDREGSGL